MDEVNTTNNSEVDQVIRHDQWTCLCSDKSEVKINMHQFSQHSGYFSALLRSPVEEHGKKQVHLRLVSASLLNQIQILLDILDSGQFELEREQQVFEELSRWTEVEEMDTLLEAIDYLDVHTLRSLCDSYFCSLQEVSQENLEYLLQLSSHFTFKQLEKKIISFLLRNILTLSKTNVEILPYYILKTLLGSNKTNVSSEWDLVEVLDSWCFGNLEKSSGYLTDGRVTELSMCLRIPQLVDDVSSERQLKRINYFVLQNRIKTGICDFERDPETYKTKHPIHFVTRRGQNLLLAMRVPFGKRLDRACSFSQNFNIDNNEDMVFNESHHLSASIPCDSLREFCVCPVGQYVYVAGGQYKYSLAGQFAVSNVYRLDLDELRWKTMSPLRISRCLFHMDSISGYLYAVGGINSNSELSSVEQYNTTTDQWSYVQRLDYAIHEHAGCVHGKQLYISGGHDGTSHVNTVCRYDVIKNTWSRCAPMLTPRSCHTMSCLNNRLYVIGGSRIKKYKVYDMQTIECYSTQTNQWSEVRTQFPSIYTACLSVYARPRSGRLLVLGGYSYKNHKYTLEMHSYCERNGVWSAVPVQFNSTRKDKTDITIIEVKVKKIVADQLVRNRRSCTLK